MYASRKVTMSTWAKAWGPGFLGEGKETHGSQAARSTPDTKPRSLGIPCLPTLNPTDPEASVVPALNHYFPVS